MKILIVNTHLETGGIRQSLLNLIDNISLDSKIKIDLQLLKYDNHLAAQFKKQERKVTLCPPIKMLNIHYHTFYQQKNSFQKIIKILLIVLSRLISRKRIVNLLMSITRKTRQYDIVISYSNDIWATHVGGFYGGCNDYVLKCVCAKKKVAWIHSDPKRLGLKHEISLRTYKKFDEIINVSNACKKIFDEIVPEYKHKSKVIYNMLNFEKITVLMNSFNPFENQIFNLVTVARLDNESKSIDKIIFCCEKIKQYGIKDFQWHIVGDGPDRDSLISLSREKGTEDVVVFQGKKENPYPYMKNADVSVLVSDYEAFGMVVAESLSVGTPVICTNYPAAQEVLLDGENGIITDFSVESIVSAILKVIENPNILEKMRKYLLTNKVSNETSSKQFESILKFTQ